MAGVKQFVINGEFLCEKMQGIVRYAREMLSALDRNINNGDLNIKVIYPHNAHNIPILNNIKLEQVGKNTGIRWEQTDLRRYLKRNKDAMCINFCNVTPLFVQPGITTIHDIMYLTDKKNYIGLKNKLSSLWHRYQYRYICKNEKYILTVSNYSKNLIEKYYPRSKGKIVITYNSWEHVKKYQENKKWQEKYPFLKPKEYFFSLATLAKNKNGKWIVEVAKRHPEHTFAIGGNFYNDPRMNINSVPENVHLLGFVDDSDACSLIKNCKAFVFPSLNEGFGLPPLEALALGAEVISSNAASLPEILGNAVHYIDPNNYEVDLLSLLKTKTEPPENTLNKFNYDKSAIRLIEIINKEIH